MKNCRIDTLKSETRYTQDGISSILLLDCDDYIGVRFENDGLYDRGMIEAIYRRGNFIEINAPDSAKENSSVDDGMYTHTLETFINDISSSLATSLHMATKKRFMVVYGTNMGKYFLFGLKEGAKLTYTTQTDGSAGSLVTVTAISEYPLLEVVPKALETKEVVASFEPDFINGAYCVTGDDGNTGYKQAVYAYKVSSDGRAIGIDNRPISETGKKQAVAVLNGYGNPDSNRYDLQYVFATGERIDGVETVTYDTLSCPISKLKVSPDTIILTDRNKKGSVKLQSFGPWRATNQLGDLVTLNLTQGEGGTYELVITRNTGNGEGYIFFTDTNTGRKTKLYVVSVEKDQWILANGTWNNLGLWKDNGKWTD